MTTIDEYRVPDAEFRVNELIEFVAGKLPSGATISGMSWNGFNVYGDEKSMKEFRRWMTEVARSDGLSRILIAERAEAASLRAEMNALLSSYDEMKGRIEKAVRLLTVCDEQRRRQTNRGLGEFGASAADIDFRRGLDGMIADFLASFVSREKVDGGARG